MTRVGNADRARTSPSAASFVLVLAVAVLAALGLGACERDVILDPSDAGSGSDGGFVPDATFPFPDATDLDAGGLDAAPQGDGSVDTL